MTFMNQTLCLSTSIDDKGAEVDLCGDFRLITARLYYTRGRISLLRLSWSDTGVIFGKIAI